MKMNLTIWNWTTQTSYLACYALILIESKSFFQLPNQSTRERPTGSHCVSVYHDANVNLVGHAAFEDIMGERSFIRSCNWKIQYSVLGIICSDGWWFQHNQGIIHYPNIFHPIASLCIGQMLNYIKDVMKRLERIMPRNDFNYKISNNFFHSQHRQTLHG